MKPPIQGMTVRPFGEDYQLPSFVACARWAAQSPDQVEQFMADTGIKLARTKLDAMIDEASGHDRAIVIAWFEWVAKTLWGAEGEKHVDV